MRNIAEAQSAVGSLMGAGPPRRSKCGLDSNRGCRRSFRWSGTSKGLGAGAAFDEGVGGSWLAENVGEAQCQGHQVKEFIW